MCPGFPRACFLGVMKVTFNEMRQDIECIFSKYRKHKYYTLFITDYSTSITSSIDKIGGGRSNKTSDKVGDAAIKIIDKKEEAKRYVEVVEQAVESLPEIEKELIKQRYMSRNHDYITDYTVYEIKMFISAPYYYKVRERAFSNLSVMLQDLI